MKSFSLLEALESYEKISENLDLGLFSLALAVSLLAALACALMYRIFYESRGTGSQIHKAFPWLAVAITTLFLCIQISIPLSLGLLGSLSIIRFRTPVKEPEEVGAVMLVIASSIAAATFHFAFIGIMLAVAAAAAALLAWLRRGWFRLRDGMVTFSLGDEAAADGSAFEAVLKAHTLRHRVLSVASEGGVTSVQATFGGLKGDACALQEAIRQGVPGVKSVNVFLDRPGGFR